MTIAKKEQAYTAAYDAYVAARAGFIAGIVTKAELDIASMRREEASSACLAAA